MCGGKLQMTKKEQIVFAVVGRIILAILLLWIISIAHCEILTIYYADEYSQPVSELSGILRIASWKVLKHSNDYSEVYFISNDDSGKLIGGTVISFIRHDKEWVVKDWKESWSSGHGTGNNDIIWPYHPIWY